MPTATLPETLSVPAFRPHPLLCNGHLQTAAGVYLPSRVSPYNAKAHVVEVEDGEAIVLHEDGPSGPSNGEVVLLAHGLTGCHLSPYMVRVASRLNERGYTVFRMDLRGCGAGVAHAEKPVHCGLGGDIAAALEHIARCCPDSPAYAVGYSLSGGILLNMLADAGEFVCGNLVRSLAICPPIDLVFTEQHLNTGFARRYNRFFARNVWKQVLHRGTVHPHLAPSDPEPPTRLRDLDERVTAPAGGFASADDYYRKASPGPKLSAIRQSVTVLKSQDDPIVPFHAFFGFDRSDAVEVLAPRSGGHLGFIGARSNDPDSRWLDWRIIDWLEGE
ncbi:MAG: alpha/beta fold hydrolase [Planctomycetota bacterium]